VRRPTRTRRARAHEDQIKKTGRIWTKSRATRDRVVKTVCSRLKVRYGQPRLGNPKKSIDDLVYIIVSNKTAPRTAARVFDNLRKSFPTWETLITAPAQKLRNILRPAGLWRVKSAHLRDALAKIQSDFGRCDLSRLIGQPETKIHAYLTSLAGVSDKVAKCVMMYTMGAKVLPVDSHVYRVATRLGWTRRKRADQCHEELEELLPPKFRHGFHVTCVLHGRSLCRPRNPLCSQCSISNFCQFYKNRFADA
jgi:endonuclease III